MRDFFEDLKYMLGCEYISDIRFAHGQIRALLGKMKLEQYSLTSLEDAVEYLFKEKIKFADYKSAKDFFCGKSDRYKW